MEKNEMELKEKEKEKKIEILKNKIKLFQEKKLSWNEKYTEFKDKNQKEI